MSSVSHLLEVRLTQPDDFKIIVETLTRVGIASATDRKLLQICFLLHKQGRYYLTHYKEMYALDGFEVTPSVEDLARRNTIATLLADWGLLTIASPARAEPRAEPKTLRILRHSDKARWQLIPKYEIGRHRRNREKHHEQLRS